MPASRPARAARLALGALLPLALACGGGGDDPVGPVDVFPVDAAQLDAVAQAVEPVSAQLVFERTGPFTFSRGLPGDQTFGARGSARASLLATGAPDAVRRQSMFVAPSIPDSLRGRTFVPQEPFIGFGWKVDSMANGLPRPGAPANGVRFVLREVRFEGQGDLLGHLDVTQQGTPPRHSLVADVYDASRNHVQRYGGPVSGSRLEGWTALGDTRIDQVSTGGRGGMTDRWTSSALGLVAERTTGVSGEALSTTWTLTKDGRRLRVQALEPVDAVTTTYTIYVGDAPFARFVEQLFGQNTGWQHVADERPLNAAELAQVRAFVRALRALPDASWSWQGAMVNLIELQGRRPLP